MMTTAGCSLPSSGRSSVRVVSTLVKRSSPLASRADTEEVTVKDLANAFLNHKHALLNAGKLSPRTWAEYPGHGLGAVPSG
jgi:hypothetical protein